MSFIKPSEKAWDQLKQDYLVHSRIPDRFVEFLRASAIQLANENVFEPDRAKEEKRKGAIILIMDIIAIHDDLIFAVNPSGSGIQRP